MLAALKGEQASLPRQHHRRGHRRQVRGRAHARGGASAGARYPAGGRERSRARGRAAAECREDRGRRRRGREPGGAAGAAGTLSRPQRRADSIGRQHRPAPAGLGDHARTGARAAHRDACAFRYSTSRVHSPGSPRRWAITAATSWTCFTAACPPTCRPSRPPWSSVSRLATRSTPARSSPPFAPLDSSRPSCRPRIANAAAAGRTAAAPATGSGLNPATRRASRSRTSASRWQAGWPAVPALRPGSEMARHRP